MVFTYDPVTCYYGRIDAQVPEQSIKTLCGMDAQDHAIVILSDMVFQVKQGEASVKLPLKSPIPGELNTNTPCFYAKGSVYFMSNNTPMQYSIAKGEVSSAG